jgi:hypothetical protein
MIQPFIKKIQITLDYILSKINGIEKEIGTLNSTVNNISESSGSGEVNTASNIGGGNGIFANKVGVDLQLKSFIEGENTYINSLSNALVISSGYVQNITTNDNIQQTMSLSKTVLNGNVESFIIKITAIQAGGSAGTTGDVWVHEFRGAIKNISGVTSVVDAITDELIAEDVGTLAYSTVIEAGTGTIDIKVTGELNKIINWKAVSVFNNNLV